MALIGTLRNRMGAWVVVFVFVAIAAFTLNDLLGNKSVLMGRNNLGEIAGNTISLEEYQNAIREREVNFQLYSNRQPGEREAPLIQEQAWEMLVSRYAIEKQFEKLDVEVPLEEEKDMLYGKNIEEGLKSAPLFQNEAGQFDPSKIKAYLQQIYKLPEGNPDRFRWEAYQRNMVPGRRRIKYENLMIKTGYVTTAEAELEYHLQSDVAEVKYLYVPYYAISDSSATVTDADLEAYYNKNKEQYKTGMAADLSYIVFPIVPSADDTLALREEMTKMAQDFKATSNDSLFAITNSDAPNAFARYSPNTLPPYVSTDSLVAGKVFGPFLDGNTFKVVKVSSVGKDTIYSARARHILVKWADENSKSVAKEKAEGILKELKAGADFAAKAREASEDPGSAQRGGDLGWFSSGDMVKPFQDAVFGASKTGLVDNVVESQFGYHIIDVTNTKDNTAYWIGTLENEITPSDASINEASRKAEAFHANVSGAGTEEFRKIAQEQGFNVLDAENIKPGDKTIGMISDARRIVQWIFRDASADDVSEVFDLNDQYVVGVVTSKLKKGYKPLAVVKDDIMPAVRNEVKGRMIIEKLSNLKGSTLDELATAFGNDASVYNNSDLRLNASSLPAIGADPKIVGLAFSLKNGNRSKPFAGENGVAIVEAQSLTIAPAIADYSLYKTQLEQNLRNRTSYTIAEAIKENSDIEDERYKFY